MLALAEKGAWPMLHPVGAGPSFFGARSFLPGEPDASCPEKQHSFSVIHGSLIPVSHKGTEHCSRGGSRGVGKCTWAFNPSSPQPPQSLPSRRVSQHAEERPCMTALLLTRRTLSERVSSPHSADTGTFLVLNVNLPLGVASPHPLPLFYLALIQSSCGPL